jgi:hypothetical protein
LMKLLWQTCHTIMEFSYSKLDRIFP